MKFADTPSGVVVRGVRGCDVGQCKHFSKPAEVNMIFLRLESQRLH